MAKKYSIKYIVNTFIFILFISASLIAQPLSTDQIDTLVERTLTTFDVPGIAVAVIKDGNIIISKGYGVRSLKSKEKVDARTLFGIASNTKAFTATALGILVDERKIKWDDKVRDFIPEFKLYNPYVTEEFTIRDLLTHRSGLGLGAGDLMIFPDSNNFTRKDIIHNLRYLKPVSGFRTKYDYDNLLYIVAGEVIAKVSGMSWEDFIETRIMQPLYMLESAASYSRLKDKSNVIDAHAPVNGKVQAIRRDFMETMGPAGGIYSNLTDMCQWVSVQLNRGSYGLNMDKMLFSQGIQDELWAPQTIIPFKSSSTYNTHFVSYGLGWVLNDVKGYKQVSHTGGLAGIVTQVTLIPEIRLGIIVLTNQQSGAAFTAITNTIKDAYLGIKGIDRVKEMRDRELQNQKEAKKITDEIWKEVDVQQKNVVKPDFSIYTGIYTDNWLGDITIAVKKEKLWFSSERSPRLIGEMLYYKGNTFIVKWNDRSMDADAFVQFTLDNKGKASAIKMNAISPLTDFSYDFQDLDFYRK